MTDYNEPLTLLVRQTKLVGDTDQDLRIQIPHDFGTLDNVSAVQLETYNITGSAGAIPTLVVLGITAGNTNSNSFDSHVNSSAAPRVHSLEQVPGHHILFPPGGATTQDRANQTLAYRSSKSTPMNLNNSKLRLYSFDATTNRYVEWSDWTSAYFKLVLVGQHRKLSANRE